MSIGVDAHHRLMKLVGANSGSLLSRLHDYYADAEFQYSELDNLSEELAALRTSYLDDEPLHSFLNALWEFWW